MDSRSADTIILSLGRIDYVVPAFDDDQLARMSLVIQASASPAPVAQILVIALERAYPPPIRVGDITLREVSDAQLFDALVGVARMICGLLKAPRDAHYH